MEHESLMTLKFFVFCSLALITWTASLIRVMAVLVEVCVARKLVVMLKKKYTTELSCLKQRAQLHSL